MRIVIPLADGLEEIEAITNIDVLRRAGIEVTTAGLNSKKINGSHEVWLEADCLLSELAVEDFDGIVLPGGMPGAANLKNSKIVVDMVKKMSENGQMIAAICAAPMVLEKAGVIKNREATSYPGFGEQMPSCNYREERVVKDGNLITGRGPGVALEFALEIVSYLLGQEQAEELKEKMIF